MSRSKLKRRSGCTMHSAPWCSPSRQRDGAVSLRSDDAMKRGCTQRGTVPTRRVIAISRQGDLATTTSANEDAVRSCAAAAVDAECLSSSLARSASQLTRRQVALSRRCDVATLCEWSVCTTGATTELTRLRDAALTPGRDDVLSRELALSLEVVLARAKTWSQSPCSRAI